MTLYSLDCSWKTFFDVFVITFMWGSKISWRWLFFVKLICLHDNNINSVFFNPSVCLFSSSTILQASDVQTEDGLCIYPKSPALVLGLVSSLALVMAQVTINIVAGCICCKKHSGPPNTNWTIGLISFIASWWASILKDLDFFPLLVESYCLCTMVFWFVACGICCLANYPTWLVARHYFSLFISYVFFPLVNLPWSFYYQLSDWDCMFVLFCFFPRFSFNKWSVLCRPEFPSLNMSE